jgi:hypothetical protein
LTVIHTFKSFARILSGALLLAVTCFAASPASAKDVSPAVKRACANDYFAHCSMHPVGTPAVRKCMRAVGPRLSKPCIGALAAAGEIKDSDRKRYKTASTKSNRRN